MFNANSVPRQTQIFLVTDAKNEKFAQLLAAMVSANDDETGNDGETGKVVGVKDGTVKATIWLEKDYKANQAQATTNDYFVFIGDNPTAKALGSVAKYESEPETIGVKIGTVGNKAVVFCDKTVIHKQKTYDTFFDSYQLLTKDLRAAYGNVSEQKKSKNVGEKINSGVNTALEKGFTGVAKAGRKIFGKDAASQEKETVGVHIPKWVTSTATGVATALVAWPFAVAGVVAMGVSKAKSNEEREAQQMNYAVLWFYLNCLNGFIGRAENE